MDEVKFKLDVANVGYEWRILSAFQWIKNFAFSQFPVATSDLWWTTDSRHSFCPRTSRSSLHHCSPAWKVRFDPFSFQTAWMHHVQIERKFILIFNVILPIELEIWFKSMDESGMSRRCNYGFWFPLVVALIDHRTRESSLIDWLTFPFLFKASRACAHAVPSRSLSLLRRQRQRLAPPSFTIQRRRRRAQWVQRGCRHRVEVRPTQGRPLSLS